MKWQEVSERKILKGFTTSIAKQGKASTGEFVDKGITGATENRPEFPKMLELCRKGATGVNV